MKNQAICMLTAAAALALFAPGESRITGAAHLRDKESDRIAACVVAVRALGDAIP